MMLDFKVIEARVIEAAQQAITDAAIVVADRARQLAPIRKVFKGGRRRLRFLTPQEHQETNGIRAALGLQPFEMMTPETKRNRGPNRPLLVAMPHIAKNMSPSSARRRFATVVTKGDSANMNAGNLRGLRPPATAPGRLWSYVAETRLSRHGRYELKTLRAAYSGSLGGRLRGEIRPTQATISGSRVEAMVISPTPYAKYQEFGTRHNPAHPFLRPAAEESVSAVSGIVRANIGKATSAGVPGRGRVVLRYSMKAGR